MNGRAGMGRPGLTYKDQICDTQERLRQEVNVNGDKAKEVKMKIFTQHIYIYEETGTQTRQSLYLMCLDHTK